MFRSDYCGVSHHVVSHQVPAEGEGGGWGVRQMAIGAGLAGREGQCGAGELRLLLA